MNILPIMDMDSDYISYFALLVMTDDIIDDSCDLILSSHYLCIPSMNSS